MAAITAHVYQIFIAAEPAQVWTAITSSEWTRQFFHGTSFDAPPALGEPYRTTTADGRPAVDGVIEELQPPGDGTPGRFVQTWHTLYDDDLAAEPPSRVEWTVEAAGEGLTRVRLVHGDLAFSPLTWANVKDGWAWILDSLKSLLETGRALPRWAREESAETAGAEARPVERIDGDWHRAQGVEANNGLWDFFAKPERTPDEDEDMLRRAYAAAYHWQRATNAKPENEGRASYMIAKALLLSDQPKASLRSADRTLRVCEENQLADFDLAYAHEARARALRALGREAESAEAWAKAVAVPIANDEDREILEADFADFQPA